MPILKFLKLERKGKPLFAKPMGRNVWSILNRKKEYIFTENNLFVSKYVKKRKK